MIPAISGQYTVEQQTTKVGYKLSTLFNTLQSLDDVFFGSCQTQKDITNQIPLWVVFEKEKLQSQGLQSTTIFDFLQKYYDWLYCDTTDGAGYQLGNKLLDLIDIDKTKNEFARRLSEIYATGLIENSNNQIELDNIKNFVKNIRKNFYQKKSTVDGIRYFFRTLYDVPEENIAIEYPKKFLLRLNGGKFYDENFVFSGATGNYDEINTLSGSYLNYSRIQDGNFYQDYSYLLKVGMLSEKYRDAYKVMAHPAGLKVIYEKTLEDYIGPSEDYSSEDTCQNTFLKNYAPYQFIYDYTNSVLGVSGDVSYYGLHRCTGCSGFGAYNAPTYVFPNWNTNEPIGNNFKDVIINHMFRLCYDPINIVNPNAGMTCGTC
jgi:hypothetical protein